MTIQEELGYVTIDEAARLLGRTKATLLKMRSEGTGAKSYKNGRTIIYKKDDLIKWFETSLLKKGRR